MKLGEQAQGLHRPHVFRIRSRYFIVSVFLKAVRLIFTNHRIEHSGNNCYFLRKWVRTLYKPKSDLSVSWLTACLNFRIVLIVRVYFKSLSGSMPWSRLPFHILVNSHFVRFDVMLQSRSSVKLCWIWMIHWPEIWKGIKILCKLTTALLPVDCAQLDIHCWLNIPDVFFSLTNIRVK